MVNVRNLRKDDDRTVKFFASAVDRGEGYDLHKFPTLEQLRWRPAKEDSCVLEEVDSGRLVGCIRIAASRRMRTNIATCSESNIVLDGAFQVS